MIYIFKVSRYSRANIRLEWWNCRLNRNKMMNEWWRRRISDVSVEFEIAAWKFRRGINWQVKANYRIYNCKELWIIQKKKKEEEGEFKFNLKTIFQNFHFMNIFLSVVLHAIYIQRISTWIFDSAKLDILICFPCLFKYLASLMCIEFKHLSIKSMHTSVNILHRINIKYKLSHSINIKHKLSQNRFHNRKYIQFIQK